jgi:tetratricopeptide (TPR) repeat protein
MSENTDVHFAGVSHFVVQSIYEGRTRDRGGPNYRISQASLLVVFLIFLFLSGCSPKQQAVDLYVDAVMLRELNENEMAVEKLNKAVGLNERFSLAHSLLGEIYQEQGDYERSAASYERATELNWWSFKDYFNLGRVYQVMKKFAQAVRAYVRACEIKPEHLEAHLNAAESFYELKEYDSALAYGERAQQIDPNVSKVQKILGDVYESQKDYEQAICSYKRALEIDSNDTEVMVSLAVAYLRTNRNEPAKELLRLVVGTEPDNNRAYQYLGYCYLRFYEQAVQAYKRESKRQDSDAEVLNSLAKEAEQVVEKALESYNKAIAINDKDWEAYRGIGVANMIRALKEGNDMLKSKAVYQWRLSLKINPEQPRRERLDRLIEKYSKK